MARFVLGNLLAGPSTRRYPYVVRPPIAEGRGRIAIDYPACIHCGACDRRCPAAAIKVGKEPKSWRIDRFACVACGLCVRVCPKKCLRMEAERPRAAAFADLASRVEAHESPPAAAPLAGPPAGPPAGAPPPPRADA
jgi:formate hydrogenlyase subunit 6/NADH:ubiquinone oxidoreductase subunit I